MKVGDLVTHGSRFIREYDIEPGEVGIVMVLDPEEIGDPEEVLVMWNDEDGLMNHSTEYLEVVNESR